MRPLLLVRPEPGLSASMAKAKAAGLTVTGVPLFTVIPIAWTPPDGPFDAMLLTSANTVRHAGPNLARFSDLPVLAVGQATADAARGFGLAVVNIGHSDASDLLKDVPETANLFHPGGLHRTEVRSPHRITSVAVYSAEMTEAVVLPTLSNWVVAVHSPRAARQLAHLVSERAQTAIAAISKAAAEACETGWQSIDVATEPTDQSLLALAAKLCQTDAS